MSLRQLFHKASFHQNSKNLSIFACGKIHLSVPISKLYWYVTFTQVYCCSMTALPSYLHAGPYFSRRIIHSSKKPNQSKWILRNGCAQFVNSIPQLQPKTHQLHQPWTQRSFKPISSFLVLDDTVIQIWLWSILHARFPIILQSVKYSLKLGYTLTNVNPKQAFGRTIVI